MKLWHSKKDCIEEMDCKNWQVKPKKIYQLFNWLLNLVNGIINIINAVEVVSELVNGEIEFRFRGAAAGHIGNLEEKPKGLKEAFKVSKKPYRSQRSPQGSFQGTLKVPKKLNTIEISSATDISEHLFDVQWSSHIIRTVTKKETSVGQVGDRT